MITYLENIEDKKGNKFSLDMLRLSFEIKEKKLNDLTRLLKWATLYQYKDYKIYKSFKSFSYRDLISFKEENANFVFGFGIMGSSQKEARKGFIEFNPNKSYYFVKPFLKQLKDICFNLELVRFDLAVDIEIDRSCVFLIREDKRRYMKHNVLISSNKFDYTEYLGSRNTGGFVKLYNKTIESGLDYDLTRLEITLDDINYNIFKKRFPKVYFYDKGFLDNNLFDDTDKILLSLMAELNNFEKINFLNRRKKNKFKKLLNSDFVKVEEEHFNFIVMLIEKIKRCVL